MISPLREEVAAEIPRFTKLTWQHRGRWRCNKCLRLIYMVARTLYLSMWFYYIPFMAIAINFMVPFLATKLGGYVDTAEAGDMSSEYADWVASQLASSNSSYAEPSVPELVRMMEDVPLQADGWKQDPEILVTALTLEEYWDCFWSDHAPYYVQALERDLEDQMLSNTAWGEPTPGFEDAGGPPAAGQFNESVL